MTRLLIQLRVLVSFATSYIALRDAQANNAPTAQVTRLGLEVEEHLAQLRQVLKAP